MAGEILYLNELAKRSYDSRAVMELHNVTHPELEMLAPRGSADLGGAGFYGLAGMAGNHSYGHVRRGQGLPGGDQTDERQWNAMPQILLGQCSLEGITMAISSRNPLAFARIFDRNSKSMIQNMTRFKAQILYKDGSGRMATFVTPVNDSVGPHIMDDVTGITEGQRFDVIDAADGTRHVLSAKVKAVNWATNGLTFDKAIPAAVDAGDHIYIQDSQTDSGAVSPRDPIGLAGSVLSTGIYLGISRDSDVNWASTVIPATGMVTEKMLLQLRMRIHVETGVPIGSFGGRFIVVMHPMQLDRLFRLAIPRVQYKAGNGYELGHDGMFTFGGMKFVGDYMCPPDTIYMGDFSYHSTEYTPGGELHIDSELNGGALKWEEGYDRAIVYAKSYYTFVNRAPTFFGKLTGVATGAR